MNPYPAYNVPSDTAGDIGESGISAVYNDYIPESRLCQVRTDFFRERDDCMTVISEKISECGEGWRLTLPIPRFADDAPERLNQFYDRLASSASELAAKLGGNLTGELHVACTGETVSLYIDFFGYRGRELVFCRRISDNRDSDGNEIPPPKAVRRLISHGGGWYTDGTYYFVYENTFTPGSASGVNVFS